LGLPQVGSVKASMLARTSSISFMIMVSFQLTGEPSIDKDSYKILD
jgi:hypothetical protein